eukprot:4750907-Amphidinium_carterae.1
MCSPAKAVCNGEAPNALSRRDTLEDSAGGAATRQHRTVTFRHQLRDGLHIGRIGDMGQFCTIGVSSARGPCSFFWLAPLLHQNLD